MPGRTYRRDAVTSRHSPIFHQVEGLVIDRDVTFTDLKGILTVFSRQMFGQDTRMRFRPDFFPFTEPSAEIAVSCFVCKGKGCRLCSGSGWLEILGAGMVHPKVIANVGHDPEKWQGFAFGMGVERIALLKYGIDDIRHFFEGDLRFLNQF
jgi:phenylalanyl-tRNA synthetase alpha chain